MPRPWATWVLRWILLLAVPSVAVLGVALVRPHPPSAAPSTPTASSRPALFVTGLGDSVPSGYGCDCRGYVQNLGDLIGATTGRQVEVHNDAVGGITSADVSDSLSDPAVAGDLASSDVVVVEVGANDLDLGLIADASCQDGTITCWRGTLNAVRTNLTRIADVARNQPRHPTVLLIGYWNVTVDGRVAAAQGSSFVATSDLLTRRVNDTIEQVATATGATYVDAYTPFKGADGTRDPSNDLQDDGDHPDVSGHQRLAEAVVSSLRASGALARWSQ